jgi:hypothetical protein
MAHNTSRQKAASYVRSVLLANYRGWHLAVTCASCGRSDRVAVELALVRYPEIRVEDAIRLLRCKRWLPRAARKCGGSPSSVTLECGEPDLEMPVWGPAAH